MEITKDMWRLGVVLSRTPNQFREGYLGETDIK